VQNSDDNVFGNHLAENAQGLINRFLNENDFSKNTVRAFSNDISKFVHWFTSANNEMLDVQRITTRDIADFKDYLKKTMATSSVNRHIVSVRRFLGWLNDHGLISSNPAKKVKELKKQALAPKGLSPSEVRKLLREIEIRHDLRANAIFHLFLYSGCRLGDLIKLELQNIAITERTGSVIFKNGKGGKQRIVPLPLAARRAITDYLQSRPRVSCNELFIGERGPLTESGVTALCTKYSALVGFKIHPHLMRHTFAHQFLKDNANDLVSLAQILGHENINTTCRYTLRKQDDLQETAERLSY
jgi:site-specific recombinase XerD